MRSGETLVTQGEPGTDVSTSILDGMLAVEVDGEPVAEIGPGAVVGERAALEGGVRTATLRAATRVRIAQASHNAFSAADLDAVAATHRREDPVLS